MFETENVGDNLKILAPKNKIRLETPFTAGDRSQNGWRPLATGHRSKDINKGKLLRNDHDSAQKTKDFTSDYFSTGPDISWFADVLKKHADAQFLAKSN